MSKIKEIHDLLDEAGVFKGDGMHPQLLERVKFLIKQRDELRGFLSRHKHTDKCLAYAAKTAKKSGCFDCIAECADSWRRGVGDWLKIELEE